MVVKPDFAVSQSGNVDTPALRAALAQYGISPKSKFFPVFTGGKVKGLNFPEDPEAMKVIKHLRSDKGLEFKEVKKEKGGGEKKPLGLSAEEKDILKKARLYAVNNPESQKPIPRCTNDLHKKEEGPPQKDKSAEKALIFDMLFIDKADLPLDPAEAFGMSPQIFVYSEGKSSVVSGAIRGLRIPCLPFRLRATAKYAFREEGLSAVKNYEKDPNGEGVLSEVMKAEFKNR